MAYALATEKEKELLIKVFQKLEENIQQYSVEELRRYSNAMSGIGLSSLIEEWIVQNELTRRYIQKQNCYPLLQNCICKSVETLDTKSIYKAFVKNGLMVRLQWKLTTKKLLELQK